TPASRAVAWRPCHAYRAVTMDRALLDWYRRFPEGWWGYHWSLPQPMSAVEIVESGSVDARLMATLWAVMARRRGVMLASEAPQAGKTTTLSALVDFLPDQTVGVFLRGWGQDMGWTDEIGPDRGFMLVNEMSDHLPIYVWGPNARAALRLAGSGYGFGGTMHADSLDEALSCLRDEVGATDPDLAGLTIYLQYSAYRTPSGMYRRVEEAWHLRTDAAGGLAPVRLAALDGERSPRLTGAQRMPVPPTLAGDGGRSGRSLLHDPAAYAILAASLGLSAHTLEAELTERSEFLAGLADRGICEPPAVARALLNYPNPPTLASEGASA
ncbi:MAG TPA: hypothetical protein VES36_01475, partial [Candidatus Limnocylindrales bacterium]|nr:hypothetical protein [Candidatus Limnocylindrales bacterium]